MPNGFFPRKFPSLERQPSSLHIPFDKMITIPSSNQIAVNYLQTNHIWSGNGRDFPIGSVSSFKTSVTPSKHNQIKFGLFSCASLLCVCGSKAFCSDFEQQKILNIRVEDKRKQMMKKLDEGDGFVLRYGKNATRRAFRDVISTSKKNGSLVCGVYDVAEVLRRGSTEDIEFCVLVKSEDPANQVFCRLIEAYCCENRIKIIKVDSAVVLTSMTDETSEKIHHCVLVMKSVENNNEVGPVLTLLNYIKHRATWSTLTIS